jgi:hypothetical protein
MDQVFMDYFYKFYSLPVTITRQGFHGYALNGYPPPSWQLTTQETTTAVAIVEEVIRRRRRANMD